MKLFKVASYDEMSKVAASHVFEVIKKSANCVLGLATGSSPVGLYRELISQTNHAGLSFRNVVTFNLDEYFGLDANDSQSYAHFMNEHLFHHVDIQKNNIYIPNGKAENHEQECKRYDSLLSAFGGVDIQILGIGRNGHIGFNEPGAFFEPNTHVVTLDHKTIEDNARFFEDKEKVPKTAISMGVRNILSAKKIILLAYGVEKAEALYKMFSGPITPSLPASILQVHPNVEVICDEAAASLLGNYF